MRILLYGLNFHPELTGVGKYTAELAEWLAARGHQVRVVCAPPYYPGWKIQPGYVNGWTSEIWRSQEGAEVEVLRCPLWIPAKPSGAKRILHLLSFALSSAPTLWGQRRWKPDAILMIAPTLACAPAALAFARLAHCPSWLHIQDLEVDAAVATGLLGRGWLARLADAAERRILLGFDRVSTISDNMLLRLRGKGGESQTTVLLTNWVDLRKLSAPPGESPYRREVGCAPGDVLVLYSGSVGEKQGLETLLEAAGLLAGEPRYRFVICAQGPAKEALAARYAHLANVQWKPLQPAERLAELLAAADIHALPQRGGMADLVMPSKLLGMMASGRPVVATAARGTEIWNVLQGRGVLVPPEDPRALADAIERLGEDPEMRRSLGAAARAYVEEHFDRDRVLEGFEAGLRALVEAHRR